MFVFVYSSYHLNLKIALNTQKAPYLNQTTLTKTLPDFPTQKNPRIKNFITTTGKAYDLCSWLKLCLQYSLPIICVWVFENVLYLRLYLGTKDISLIYSLADIHILNLS